MILASIFLEFLTASSESARCSFARFLSPIIIIESVSSSKVGTGQIWWAYQDSQPGWSTSLHFHFQLQELLSAVTGPDR